MRLNRKVRKKEGNKYHYCCCLLPEQEFIPLKPYPGKAPWSRMHEKVSIFIEKAHVFLSEYFGSFIILAYFLRIVTDFILHIYLFYVQIFISWIPKFPKWYHIEGDLTKKSPFSMGIFLRAQGWILRTDQKAWLLLRQVHYSSRQGGREEGVYTVGHCTSPEIERSVSS